METDMELFSEVYGCYFTVVAKILEQAQCGGMSKAEIENMVNAQAFCDSAFHLLPKLFSGEWNLLEKKSDGNYYAKPQLAKAERPMTNLEKAWLKSLLSDKRILLFVSQDELKALERALTDVAPLFSSLDFHAFDVAADGDPYGDVNYIQNFKAILKSCILLDIYTKKPIDIGFIKPNDA